jgi:hypothetical protein
MAILLRGAGTFACRAGIRAGAWRFATSADPVGQTIVFCGLTAGEAGAWRFSPTSHA